MGEMSGYVRKWQENQNFPRQPDYLKQNAATWPFPLPLPFPAAMIHGMEPREVKYHLGSLTHIEPRTFGRPGQRTFNLMLESGDASCTVWLEKEQLFQLGVYLQQAVESISEADKAREGQRQEPRDLGQGISLDFKAGQLMLSHDQESNSFRLLAYEIEDEEANREPESVSFWIDMRQAEELSQEALRICAAGRPRCILCGQPINPDGHNCPRANGHAVLETG